MDTKKKHPMLKIQLGEDGNPEVYAQGTPNRAGRALHRTGRCDLHGIPRPGGGAHQHDDDRRRPYGQNGGSTR